MLLCRGNRLLTGSNTRCLRLWDIEAVQKMKIQEKVYSVEDRSVAFMVDPVSYKVLIPWINCLNIFMLRHLYVDIIVISVYFYVLSPTDSLTSIILTCMCMKDF